ncbi:MAG: hypothetical protein AB7F43_05795 [Bacteriovoracia bacterium]
MKKIFGRFVDFAFENRIFAIGLGLRAILLVFVLATGRFWGGDSNHYLYYAQQVFLGQWGGESNRVPFYLWFLCLFSPNVSKQAGSADIFFSLLVQSLLVVAAGYYLFKRFEKNKKLANKLLFFWIFDPVLLIFSNLVMADALFSVLLIFVGLFTLDVFEKQSIDKRKIILMGGLSAAAILTRTVALPVFVWTAVLWLLLCIQKKQKISGLVLWIVITSALLAPRLYWCKTRYDRFTLATQGESWMMSVAGVVENYGKGLDFYQSEEKWFRDHPHKRPDEVFRSIFSHFGSWLKLSAKGWVRVLVGHVNVEWGSLLFGESPLGPSWFKVQEHRSGLKVQGLGIVAWILGLLFTALFALSAYFFSVREMCRKFSFTQILKSPFLIWAVGSFIFLVLSPQVFGDARFRVGIWPFVLLIWGYCGTSSRKQKAH